MQIPGIHHITAIAGDPQRNVDFYTQVLGLRLVKLTVNFDDPGSYHLYYGDKHGTPGTILTFFPWPGVPRGRRGNGEASVITLSVPSLDGWLAKIPEARPEQRFGADVLAFTDPDGMKLELVAGPAGVTLSESGYEATAKLLVDVFGYTLTGSEENRYRYTSTSGSFVDVLCQPEARRGGMGAGTIHHVAFRAETDDIQKQWRKELIGLGYDVTPVLDRQYFHSIYFREPGGVLFEIATDPPGFATDETPDKLGTHLKLPPWLEPQRPQIELTLPTLKLPPYAG